jgi:hypothetical protein
MKAIELTGETEFERMVIASIGEGLLVGKLDPKNKMLYVQSTYGRDVKETQINDLLDQLKAWDQNLLAASSILDSEVISACKESIVKNA